MATLTQRRRASAVQANAALNKVVPETRQAPPQSTCCPQCGFLFNPTVQEDGFNPFKAQFAKPPASPVRSTLLSPVSQTSQCSGQSAGSRGILKTSSPTNQPLTSPVIPPTSPILVGRHPLSPQRPARQKIPAVTNPAPTTVRPRFVTAQGTLEMDVSSLSSPSNAPRNDNPVQSQPQPSLNSPQNVGRRAGHARDGRAFPELPLERPRKDNSVVPQPCLNSPPNVGLRARDGYAFPEPPLERSAARALTNREQPRRGPSTHQRDPQSPRNQRRSAGPRRGQDRIFEDPMHFDRAMQREPEPAKERERPRRPRQRKRSNGSFNWTFSDGDSRDSIEEEATFSSRPSRFRSKTPRARRPPPRRPFPLRAKTPRGRGARRPSAGKRNESPSKDSKDSMLGFLGTWFGGKSHAQPFYSRVSAENVRKTFQAVDPNGTGLINRRQFFSATKRFRFQLTKRAYEAAFRKADPGETGKLDIHDYQTAIRTLKRASFERKKQKEKEQKLAEKLPGGPRNITKIKSAFRRADVENLGALSRGDFEYALELLGLDQVLTPHEIGELFRAIDKGEGEVSWEPFAEKIVAEVARYPSSDVLSDAKCRLRDVFAEVDAREGMTRDGLERAFLLLDIPKSLEKISAIWERRPEPHREMLEREGAFLRLALPYVLRFDDAIGKHRRAVPRIARTFSILAEDEMITPRRFVEAAKRLGVEEGRRVLKERFLKYSEGTDRIDQEGFTCAIAPLVPN